LLDGLVLISDDLMFVPPPLDVAVYCLLLFELDLILYVDVFLESCI